MQSLRDAASRLTSRMIAYRHFYRIVRRDIRIASAIAFAIMGFLMFVEKHWPDAFGRTGDILLDFFKWVASLSTLLSL
jgi:hypothetical protein